jgi:hypothetical protein
MSTARVSSSAPCPDENDLLALWRGQARQDRVALEAHVARCSVCRQTLLALSSATPSAHDPSLLYGLTLPANEPVPCGDPAEETLAVGQSVGRYRILECSMEYVDGQTLSAWLGAKRRTTAEILTVFQQAGRGLAAAHAVGLVHRDFKPANVLVGRNGRVHVADFGLAWLAATPAETPENGTSRGGITITERAEVAGTPSYMSPEQFRGESADASTDQFSFCIALHEALYGQRPFRGDSLDALRQQVLSGRRVTPRRERPVPRWLRRVLARGLALDPSDRFPSMSALLAAMSRGRIARLWGPALLVLTVAAGASGLGYRHLGGRALCRGSQLRGAQIWDTAHQSAVEAALLATGRPFAEDAWHGTQRLLGRYLADWGVMRQEACEATHVRGEQSAELLDLRMQCLDERLEEARGLIGLLSSADAGLAGRAAQAASRLSPLAACADATALRSGARSLGDPVLRQRVFTLRKELAQVKALALAARYPEAMGALTPLMAQAERVGDHALLANALYHRGRIEQGTGKPTAAEATYRAALVHAGSGHDDALLAQITVELMSDGDQIDRDLG